VTGDGPHSTRGSIVNVQDVARSPIPTVVSQHVEDAAAIRSTRTHLVSAPHVKLLHLGRWDERLAAHLDGVAVAGDFGARLAEAALESAGVGEVFVAAVNAIQTGNSAGLDKLFSLVEAIPDARKGLTSAFGWVSAETLKGTARALLDAAAPFRKRVGIAACAMHRVDPGAALNAAIASRDAALRARALRCAGEVGRRDLLPTCVDYTQDEDPTCAFWAAWSAMLLGDRSAVGFSRQLVFVPGPHQECARQLVSKVLNNEDARAVLKALAPQVANPRILIEGTGTAGDPFYVPWLIKQMADEKVARLAGESFSLITGIDLAYLDLERKPPEGVDFGPTDNPEDENVAMDPDDGLPWPDPDKIQKWWDANTNRFQAGVRYFMGEPVNVENCKRVLREGYQRQRIAAALHLSLLQPGTPLFPTSAPAWRQQRWLSKMS
jgi:uncharacterized protein (TIGR02270 family)